MKCTPEWSKLYQPVAQSVLAVAFEEQLAAAVVEHVVLAGDVEDGHAGFLENLVGVIEFLGPRQVADVAGVQMKAGLFAMSRMRWAASRKVTRASGLGSLLKPMWLSLTWTKVRGWTPLAMAWPAPSRVEVATPPPRVQTTPPPAQPRHSSTRRRFGSMALALL
jgi:hypothetical protein